MGGGAERSAQRTTHSPLHYRSQQLLTDLEMAEQTERGEIESVAPLEKKDDVAWVQGGSSKENTQLRIGVFWDSTGRDPRSISRLKSKDLA